MLFQTFGSVKREERDVALAQDVFLPGGALAARGLLPASSGKGGPQNCQVTPKLAVRRPSLQTEILSPALLLHSLCRQLSGPLEYVHGQVVSSSANIHEYLLSQDCAGHSGCYNSG